ncbi:MAG: hypothetical protein ACRC46_14150 [Thermoguttaceae bacterium]
MMQRHRHYFITVSFAAFTAVTFLGGYVSAQVAAPLVAVNENGGAGTSQVSWVVNNEYVVNEPTESTEIDFSELQDVAPQLGPPPQLVASALRDRYLPHITPPANTTPFELSVSIDNDILNAYKSDFLPVALDEQLVHLEKVFHEQMIAAARRQQELTAEDAASEDMGAARSYSPIQASGVIGRLRLLIRAVVYAMEYDPSAVREPLDQLHACVSALQDDATMWEQEAVVACVDMLERRLIIWEAVLAARLEQDKQQTDFASQSRTELVEWTTLAREFLASPELAPHGPQWTSEWKVDEMIALLKELEGVSQLNGEQAKRLNADAAELMTRLDPATFTSVQRRLLKVPGVPAWRKSLAPFAVSLVSPLDFLRSIETFEKMPTPENELTLRTQAQVLVASPLKTMSELGTTTLSLYSTPNIKLYLSVVLLNHLLPAPGREYARFRDVVAGRDVTGRRRTDTQVALTTIPNESDLRFALNIRGKVAALGTSSAMATTLQSISSAEYIGQKVFAWTDNGFVGTPASVSVNNARTSLRSVQPGMGFPLLGGMMSNAVRSQYEFRQDEITAETRSKIVQQVRTKINGDTEAQFAKVNSWYRNQVIAPLEGLGLTLQMSESRSDAHWLLPSWRLGRPSVLAAYPPAPETPYGVFADVKVHESTANILLDSLDIAGKTLTIGELRQHLLEKTKQPGLFQGDDNGDITVCLADEHPIRLRFHHGCIEVALSVAMIKYNQQTIRNFEIFATYVPQEMGDGTLHLVREGIVRLGGDILPRHQIPLRTIFGKVFAAQRSLEMTPESVKNDPRFDGLTTGLCRIENGWFAVGLVLEREANDSAAPTAVEAASRPRRTAR